MEVHKRELYRLRMMVGLLGATLPILLIIGNNGTILNSMSHYYYSSSNVFFIGILVAFSVVLFSYFGYEKLNTEKVSDNTITSFAAVFALITVLLPTSPENSGGIINTDLPHFLGSYQNIYSTIHLLSAGLFLSLLAYMSYFKFTLAGNTKVNLLYKVCAILVWSSVLMILIFNIIDMNTNTDIQSKFKYVWWFECVAVESFALAWLQKAGVLKFRK